jgi:FixJ family two-component response regulator
VVSPHRSAGFLAADFLAALIKERVLGLLRPLAEIPAAAAATFVGNHEGDDSMALRSMTVQRYEEIRRRLAEGRSLREIARALGCSRRTVREVRDGERVSPDAPKATDRSAVDGASGLAGRSSTIWDWAIR